MAVKGINGADLNNISKVDGRSNVLDKVNGIDADLSPPAVAYSVRNVSGLTGVPYDGPAMRILVDATGDGADATDLEFDINFTADGDLDVADIELKCAGGKDAYVVKWYDQSGAGNDATQTAYADMPKIATAGVVILESGQPAVEFNATSSTYGLDTPDIDITPGHVICVTRFDSTAMSNSFCLGSNTTEGLIRARSTTPNMSLIHDYTTSSSCAYEKVYRNSTDLLQISPTVRNGFAGSMEQQNLFFTDDATTNNVDFRHIGKNQGNNGLTRWVGTIQEVIAYDSDQSSNRPTIENNINSYFNIYQSRENILPGAAAAYSLRQLSDSSRLAIRVRRDTGVGSGTDDDEADVGFDANGEVSLDSPVSNFDPTGSAATTLGEFLADAAYDDEDSLGAPADGFVTAWYDQSANANNATQTAPASQPKIYDSSTGIVTLLGKPSVDFLGSGFLTLDGDTSNVTNLLSSTGFSHFAVVESVNDNTQYISGTPTAGAQTWNYSQTATSSFIRWGGNFNTFNFSNSSGSARLLNTDYNGVTDLTTATKDGEVSSNSFSGGSNTDYRFNSVSRFSSAYSGNISEAIIYLETKDSARTDIEGNINAHYGIANFGTPSSGLLADYPGSAAAYSVRKLADTASLAMRIIVDDTAVIGTVDASDTEYDIGFDANGDLDVARIREVCNNPSGANYNAYVVTWYDQSGNGNHATQATYTACPKIYDGVDVTMENGNPSVQFDGTDDNLQTSSSSWSTAGDLAYFMVMKTTTTSPQEIWNTRGVSSTRSFNASLISTFNHAVYSTSSETSIQGTATLFQCLQTLNKDGSNMSQYLDGTLTDSDSSAINANTASAVAGIGARSAFPTRYLNGSFQEIIHYPVNQTSNRSGIETDIDSYYRIYGDPDDGLLSTPYGKGAAAAYSVRRLSNNATRAMRILVDADANGPDASDNEYDIGFDANGELDIARIEELCDKGTGNYDAYVTTWYDQSGEGNDATQTAYASMPKICDAGTVITENGKPALEFNQDGFTAIPGSKSNILFHQAAGGLAMCVLNPTANTQALNRIAENNGAGSGAKGFIFGWDDRVSQGDNDSGYYSLTAGTGPTGAFLASNEASFVTGSQSLMAIEYDWDAGIFQYQDGSLLDSSLGTRTPATGDATFDINYGATGGLQCTMQELILYNAHDANRTLIESNINDYFNIEGV